SCRDGSGGPGHRRAQSRPDRRADPPDAAQHGAHARIRRGLNRIVKMTVVLADSADYDEMNRVWREFFPVDPPARTTCALQLSNGNGVEIECIALAGERPSHGV